MFKFNYCPIVYLAGGIHGLSDAECNDWRSEAKRHLPKTLDPMRRDYRGLEHLNAKEIVTGDLADIDRCTVVLAMCLRPSWGTAMEIMYSWNVAKPVFSIVSGSVSPWLAYHTDVSNSLEEAIRKIREMWSW